MNWAERFKKSIVIISESNELLLKNNLLDDNQESTTLSDILPKIISEKSNNIFEKSNNKFTHNDCIKVSYYITCPLRHDTRWKVNSEGFCNLYDFYKDICKYIWNNYEQYSWDIFVEIIKCLAYPKDPNEKIRFELNDDDSDCKKWEIRASQGHSRNDVNIQTYDKIIDKNIILCHSTHHTNIQHIMKEGLKAMGRQHVHFYKIDSHYLKIHANKRNCDSFICTKVSDLINANHQIYYSKSNEVCLVKAVDNVINPNIIWHLKKNPW